MMMETDASDKDGAQDPETYVGFVALLDVLGFKTMSKDRQINVASLLEQAVDEILPHFWDFREMHVNRWLGPTIVRMFSDTIIIAFPRLPNGPVAQDLFHYVNDYVGMFFCFLLSEGITLRGAIGYGTIVDRKYGVYGSAIIDAQCEYERTEWAGVHYTVDATRFIALWFKWARDNAISDQRTLPSTDHYLNEAQLHFTRVPFKPEYQLPTSIKSESVRYRFVVPWPKDLRTVFDLRRILLATDATSYTRIHEVLEPQLEQCVRTDVRIKIENTLSFADRYLEKFPGVNQPISWHGPVPPMS